MYREMTAEEKLEYSAAIINAIKEGGLEASLKVVEEYERKLSTTEEMIELEKSNELPKEASIYASEHIDAVEEDKNQDLVNQATSTAASHHKSRILINPNIPSFYHVDEDRKIAPSPYQDAKIVEPGHFNNSNKML